MFDVWQNVAFQRPISTLLPHDSYGAPPALVLGTLERHDAHLADVVDAARAEMLQA